MSLKRKRLLMFSFSGVGACIIITSLSQTLLSSDRKYLETLDYNNLVSLANRFDFSKIPSNYTRTFNEAQRAREGRNRTYILIMAGYRTGSSFAASMFDTNPDIFYMFEPLTYIFPVGKVLNYLFPTTREMPEDQYAKLEANASSFVWDFFKCNFLPTVWFSKELYPHKIFDLYLASWSNRIFHSMQQRHGYVATSSQGLHKMEQTCLSYNTRAVKVVRVGRVETLLPLMERGMKIIYIIRDPRGKRASAGRRTMPSWCANLNSNLEFIKVFRNQKLLHDQFRILRYEDLALHPIEMTKLMYEFVHLPIPEAVLEHARTNRKVNTWHGASDKKPSKFYPVKHKWISKLSPEDINQVEAMCGDGMNQLGYRLSGLGTSEKRKPSHDFASFVQVPVTTKYVFRLGLTGDE